LTTTEAYDVYTLAFRGLVTIKFDGPNMWVKSVDPKLRGGSDSIKHGDVHFDKVITQTYVFDHKENAVEPVIVHPQDQIDLVHSEQAFYDGL